MSFNPVTDLPDSDVPPCEEFAAVVDTIYQHLVAERLDEFMSTDLWRDLDILRDQCHEMPVDLQAKFEAIRHASSNLD